MKKPIIGVTKWLGDIPVEANCKLVSRRRLQSEEFEPSAKPREYQKSLQEQVDSHCKAVHSQE